MHGTRFFSLLTALTLSALPQLGAGNVGTSTGGITSAVDREMVRRQENLTIAAKLISQGDAAMKAKEYATAYSRYLDAVDRIGSGPDVQKERAAAVAKFSAAGVAYAEYLIANGRYSDAEKVAKTVLLQQYNPTYKPAILLLSRLEQPNYYNKTVTPRSAADREEVKQLLVDAQGFYSSGRFDLAMKRYDQVLAIDPYNIAARKGQEQLHLGKRPFDSASYNDTRSRMLTEVEGSWQQPVQRYGQARLDPMDPVSDRSGTERMTAKLNSIIIPKLDIKDVTVREAVSYLQQLSRQLDTQEPNIQKRGVNIFLKLDTGVGTTAQGSTEGTPGTEGAPGMLSTPATTPETPITLQLNNIPFYEALRYLASYANLKVKVDPYAVSIVPLTTPTDDLISKEYRVPPNFIPNAPRVEEPTGFPGGGQTPTIVGRANARDYLESQGVLFPEGASANYNAGANKLVVRNTRDNIDLIDYLVDAAMGIQQLRVEIETKFLEVNQNNLKELGFDWTLGPVVIPGSQGVVVSGGGTQTNAANYSFLGPSGAPIGTNPMTTGLRSGSDALSATTIEGIIGRQQQTLAGALTTAAPSIFSIAGVYTNPQFQLMIRALNQKKGIDLMAAPKIVTDDKKEATINITREFRYPTEFTPPEVPDSTGATSSGSTVVGVFAISPPITPSTPSNFEMRETGVILRVTPDIDDDKYTIGMQLNPEITDFDGFINYGVPIIGFSPGSLFTPPTPTVISQNTINQPIFSTRRVSTSVYIWDGQTVALGGLIREDIQKVQDKVPILGDIPLAGRLFRSDVDQKLKRNLIIFVTARILDAEGRPLRSSELQEDLVEPLGVPEDLPRPLYPSVSFGK